ncbi:AAA family ATPase [Natrialbaceae archaeon AArc-T1-2]|uniref:AAA family ATPase n=1 Tax=Natrialbaceae archaeon AArc-T1-2 TaxID=3053904 RepID=UPI00255A998D|nr:AAA family ATPase [Natrialbaceae archaeon AArc-T1-2]WIV68408.1 AAA family ATPase [Natrialbaceae archaeon AArc-T1-2]
MIVVVCGPPAAGKTTIARGVRNALDEQDIDVRLFHSEDVSSPTYERLYRLADAAADTDADVVMIDGTVYKREWQTQFRTLDLEDVRFVYVTASLETCLERNRCRAEPIDESGVHVIYREFHEPDADLVIDTDKLSASTAVDRIVDAIDRWMEPS